MGDAYDVPVRKMAAKKFNAIWEEYDASYGADFVRYRGAFLDSCVNPLAEIRMKIALESYEAAVAGARQLRDARLLVLLRGEIQRRRKTA